MYLWGFMQLSSCFLMKHIYININKIMWYFFWDSKIMWCLNNVLWFQMFYVWIIFFSISGYNMFFPVLMMRTNPKSHHDINLLSGTVIVVYWCMIRIFFLLLRIEILKKTFSFHFITWEPLWRAAGAYLYTWNKIKCRMDSNSRTKNRNGNEKNETTGI